MMHPAFSYGDGALPASAHILRRGNNFQKASKRIYLQAELGIVGSAHDSRSQKKVFHRARKGGHMIKGIQGRGRYGLLFPASMLAMAAPARAQTAPGSANDTSATSTATQSNSTTPDATHGQTGAPAADAAGGDIVVTALKRSSNLENTPLSISAVTGDRLLTLGVTDTTALARVSPGLVITPSTLIGSRITLRNIRAAGEPTVGLYYDETPLTGSAGVGSDAGGSEPTLQLFDVDRVEVLRGPQGTLYGSSSPAGAVRLIFNKPNLEKYEGVADGEFNGTSGGTLGFKVQGAVNVPLVTDLLAVRIVGFYDNQPGYIDNTTLGRKNVNDSQLRGGRALIQFKPTDNLRFDGLVVYQNQNAQVPTYNLAAGAYVSTFRTLQPVTDRFRLYSGTATWDLGPVEFVGTGSHSYRSLTYAQDLSDFFIGSISRLAPTSPNIPILAAQIPSSSYSPQLTKTDTAELRAVSQATGPLKATAGFFYSNRIGNIDSDLVLATASGIPLAASGPTLLGQRTIVDRLRQLAGYVEVTYDLTSRLSITGGGRYFSYTRRVQGAVPVVDALVGFSASAPTNQSTTDHGWLYKGNISYKLADHILLYGTVSNGERPGGINQAVGLPATSQVYQSDRIYDYELGAKNQFLDKRVTVNVDIFQMNWNDMQTSGQLGNFTFIANVGKARIKGVEADTTLIPFNGFQLSGSGSYIDSKLLQDQTSSLGFIASGKAGDKIPYVPDVTLQGSADYTWALFGDLKGLLHADAYYTGPSYIQFRRTNAYLQRLDPYTTVNLRAGITSSTDGWSVAAFTRNVTDNHAIINKLNGNTYGGPNAVRAISIAPRTIGVELSKRF